MDVFTAIATAPDVHGPICNPETVTTNVVLTAAPDVVITKLAVVVAPHVSCKPAILVATDTVGVTEEAKKFGGYIMVIVPPGGMCKDGVKVKVADTGDLSGKRSNVFMTNCTDVTVVNSTLDITESADVEMRKPPILLASVKIVKPEQVTVMLPLGKEVVAVIMILPSRTKDVDAVDGAGLDTSHFPVLPMNGK